MIIRGLFAVLCLFYVSAPAMAADSSDTDICAYLPDYVPGLDVHGNPVVAADLDGGLTQPIVDPIDIPVTMDIAERYGFPLPEEVDSEASLAVLRIHDDGRVEYNGQDISDEMQSACSMARLRKNIAPPPAPPAFQEPEAKTESDVIEGEYLE